MEGHFACATLGLPGSGGNLGGLDGSWKGGRGHGSVPGPPGDVLDAPWSSKSLGIDSHIESLGIDSHIESLGIDSHIALTGLGSIPP